jgi:phage pi2 protein 07
MMNVLSQTFDLYLELKENSMNYVLCHRTDECQLTYENNGWSYYVQNGQCRRSHHQWVIDRLINHPVLESKVSLV